jgi:prepilin-type N-terminal cleavage/methylation domain-containing protein
MMPFNLRKLSKQQSGFTLIEVMIGIVIVSVISIAVAMIMGAILKVSAGSSHRVTAIRQVQNAGMWVTQDVLSSQTVTIGGSHFLEVLWADWDGTKYKVDYDYDTAVPTDLVRRYYVKHPADAAFPSTPTSQTVAAHYIDPANTTFVTSSGFYKLTVTAKISGFSANGQPVSETRVYEILPRPGS